LASSSVVGQRSTRSANRPRVATLKLKFSDKGEVQKVQGGQLTSFLGNYSREADSDPDEPLVFEEQFILRVPDKVVRGDKEKGIKGIKTLLEEKKEVNNAFFKFKGQSRFPHSSLSLD
jgi:transcription initiation factor TFIID subunit 7